jgi:hypothetical protein
MDANDANLNAPPFSRFGGNKTGKNRVNDNEERVMNIRKALIEGKQASMATVS